jgi:hypothetical protein
MRLHSCDWADAGWTAGFAITVAQQAGGSREQLLVEVEEPGAETNPAGMDVIDEN